MGQIFRRDNYDDPDAPHIATGKWPFAAGEQHYPQWSEWEPDPPLKGRRVCLFEGCDQESFR